MLMQTTNEAVRGHGVMKVTIPVKDWGVNGDSIVLASATEMGVVNGIYQPFVGSAGIEILSVAPQPNSNVDVKINVDWTEDLNVRITLVSLSP